MHIGGRLKQLIEKNPTLNKKEFASKTGYREQALHKMFHKEDLSTAVLKTMCDELGISLQDFFDNHSARQKGSSVAEPKEKYGKEKDDCAQVRRELNFLKDQNETQQLAIRALAHSVETFQRLGEKTATKKRG